MFEPEYTQEEIERMPEQKEQQQATSAYGKCFLSALIRSISSCVCSGSNI